MQTPSRAPADVVTRLARRDEGAALAEVYAKVTMDADLKLAVERDPNFFALYDMEHDAAEQRVVTFDKGGQLEGVASFLGRDAYLAGKRTRTAYMTDLRFTSAIRGGTVLGSVFREQFEQASDALGAELMYTLVFDGNEAAKKALVSRDPRFPNKPLYRPLRSFVITNVLLAHPRRPRKTPYVVTRAKASEMEEVLAFLEADQRTRPFGDVLFEGRFARRLTKWPGFSPESFYLARSERGTLVGCFAPWDAHAVKRYRVLDYRGSMKAVKAGYGALSKVLGSTPLPEPGELLRYAYATHLCVPSHDPRVLMALLDRAYADLRGGEHAFLMLYMEREDPLRAALRGYLTSGMGATFYAVCRPDSPWATHDFGTDARPGAFGYVRPGFEIALA
ncbi:MAG: hypothetical protein H6721_32070 [Sandaracinus sp.]|nr:hypothetical protein [Myxococcales bacterium]MCB9614111.1 hypothetical protein [Sandaracinus sp.]MCB9636772.1 hypothetical protein [Sandaracinus sp.]